jgi:hypothetical protein
MLVACTAFAQSTNYTQHVPNNTDWQTLRGLGTTSYRLSTHKMMVNINGVSENYAMESWVLANALSGTGSANRIAYWTSTTGLSFGPYWDNSNNRIGLNVATPHAGLHYTNTDAARKIILQEGGDNDHQFFGLGEVGTAFGYHVSTTSDNHIFYAGTGASTSAELFKILGSGVIQIPIAPTNDNTESSFLVRQSDGQVQTKNDVVDGSGANTRFALWTDANTLSSDGSITYGGNAVSFYGNTISATTTSFSASTGFDVTTPTFSVNGDLVTGGNLLTTTNTISFVDPTAIPVDNGNTRLLSISAGAGSSIEVREVSSIVPALTAGTYTPTVTNSTNVSANTPELVHYLRVGNQVSVTGSVSFTCTASTGATSLRLSLPVTSSIGATSDAKGIATPLSGALKVGIVAGNVGASEVTIQFNNGTGASGSSDTYYFTFTYTVI